MKKIPEEIMQKIILAQKNEITEYHIYKKLAKKISDNKNRKILEEIAEQEKMHAEMWSKYTNVIAKPNRFRMWLYSNISLILGLTFGVKLMEYGEKIGQVFYHDIEKYIPEAKQIEIDEHEHENKLIEMIDEKILQYMGSVVLGLNDALVELTGVLAGLTLGLQNGNLIATVGLITGISAAFSMAGSEYLSVKTEEGDGDPIKSALYTGIAYLGTVVFLILPFFLIGNVFAALGVTLAVAILIIFIFNFYLSVAKGYHFKTRFWEMVAISMGVALISFGIGFVIRTWFGVDV